MESTEQVFTDKERQDFVEKLDAATGVELSEWESKFVESMKKRNQKYDLSEKQRAALDRMIKKYRDAIKW